MAPRLLALLAISGCSFTAATGQPEPDGAAPPAPDATIGFRCAGKTKPSKVDELWQIESGGITRSIAVHVPESYDPSRGVPLVLDIHGFTSDAVQEQLLSRMPDKADAEGFITMQPFGLGLPRSFNAGACCGLAAATHVDDVAFIRALVDTAIERLCVDPTRVYATGMSNGGFLSHRLGCELSDRIAAVAPVAGTLGISSCKPARPVPVLAFNGTADPLVPYNGSSALGFLSVPETFAGWGARNACVGAPVVTYQQGDATCRTYTTCENNAQVTLCTIDGGGHTWPGGIPIPVFGKTSTDLNATDLMWSFFQAHTLADT